MRFNTLRFDLRTFIVCVLALNVLALSACSREDQSNADSPDLWDLNIDPFAVTLSGIDSGAQLAMHFHHAHSERVRGIGLFAPRPYDCARGVQERVVDKCSGGGTPWPDSEQALSEAHYSQLEQQRVVQPGALLTSDIVWVSRGEKNQQISADLTHAVVEWYRQSIHAQYVTEVTYPAVANVWPTQSYGEDCTSQSLALGNCDLDAAGDMLAALYGFLEEASEQTQPISTIDQAAILGDSTQPINRYFAPTGYAYVPRECAEGSACSLHIALHGCSQRAQEFALHSGLNRWADSNRLIILYPQAASGSGNPDGCWDWWGFSGDEYATLDGQHIEGLLRLIHYLSGVRTYSPDNN